MFIAAITSASATRLLLFSRFQRHFLDHPNERSLHDTPRPRIGGIGIAGGILVALFLIYVREIEIPGHIRFLLLGALVVFVISIIDDVRSLSASIRIPFHVLAALVLIISGLGLERIQVAGFVLDIPFGVSVIISILYVAWMVNLYNFMDGMDGFAGGMTIIGFGSIASIALAGGSVAIAAVSVCVAGSAIGFLFYNFPPARVFMGDTGASTVGFLAAGLSLWADYEGIIPLWISVIVFSPFIVDATVTLIGRIWRRERIWRAHRTHYYQRLVQMGWGHRKTVFVEYLLMLACGLSAFLALDFSPLGQWLTIFFWIIMYLLFIIFIHRLENKKRDREVAESV